MDMEPVSDTKYGMLTMLAILCMIVLAYTCDTARVKAEVVCGPESGSDGCVNVATGGRCFKLTTNMPDNPAARPHPAC